MTESILDRTAIEALRAAFHARLAQTDTEQKLQALDADFLSRKSGSVTALLKSLPTLPVESRREFGQLVNLLKTEIEGHLDERRRQLAETRPP